MEGENIRQDNLERDCGAGKNPPSFVETYKKKTKGWGLIYLNDKGI
jgi:hypothetical protein